MIYEQRHVEDIVRRAEEAYFAAVGKPILVRVAETGTGTKEERRFRPCQGHERPCGCP